MSNATAAVYDLLCLHASIDQASIPRERAQKLNHLSSNIVLAATAQHPARDQRPDILEAELNAVRVEIRALVRRLSNLDDWAASVARRADTEKALEAAGSDVGRIMATIRDAADTPQEDWLDKATIRQLQKLDDALKRPIEVLIRRGEGLNDGRGAKPNLVARRVALAAAQALIVATGRPPSYWRDATAFAKLTADLFRVFDIRADTRRPCEWALSKLGVST